MLHLLDQQKGLLNSNSKLGEMSDSAIKEYRDRNERINELSKELDTTPSESDPNMKRD
jgi:hypothetical protein